MESAPRYTAPTRFDKSPFGTIVKVILNDDGTTYKHYVQTSETDDMEWMTYGDFLEFIYEEQLEDIDYELIIFKQIKAKKKNLV